MEFAIVGPLLLLFLIGIIVYGGYFLLAHSVQQLANDSARAALAGLTSQERSQLAQARLSSELPTYRFLSPTSVQLSYVEQNQVMTVNVAYDASSNPLWAINGLVPLPSSTITRAASVQVGGY